MSHIYEVVACQQTSPTTMTFTLHNTNPDFPLAYQPGQYATISFMRHGRPTPARCFSITSSPTEQDILQFSVRVKGYYTQSAALNIKPGDTINVSGPFGGFIFNAERDKTSVFLAGGIGIAPFMSMIRYATRLSLPNEIMLLYGCQSQDDVAFAEELMYIEQINPHFHVVFAVSQGPLTRFSGRRAVSGRVTPELLYQVIGGAYTSHSFFICGPPPFTKGMLGTLRANNTPEHRILTEAFSQASLTSRSWASRPSNIYAMTVAGLLVGAGSTMAHDIMNPKSGIVVKTENGANEGVQEGVSSRASAIDQGLSEIQTSDGSTLLVDQSGQVVGTADSSGAIQSTNTSSTTGGTTPAPTGTVSGGAGSGGGSSSGTSTPQTKPILSFNSSSSSVVKGGSATLSWSTSSASALTCTGSGGWSGSKAGSGSLSVTPSSTTTYTLTCANSAGSVTKQVTINVTAAPVAPTVTIGASATSITAGGSTTLNWSVSGTAPITCTASGGWSGSKAASGSQSVSPSATTTYVLTCSNTAGQNTKSVTVNVTAAPVSPSISFSANPTTIDQGSSTTLTWSTGGTTPITCTASGGWSGGQNSSGSVVVWPSATTTYSLNCSNAAGGKNASVTITVNPVSSGS